MSKRRVTLGMDRLSGLYLWALFIIIFSLWEPDLFPTSSTVHILASGQAVDGILAIAVLIPLVTGAYDLSIGLVANFATILVTWLQTQHHFSPILAVLAVLVISAVIGTVSGFIVVRLGVSSFIATLGIGTVVGAFTIIISGDAQPVPATSHGWLDFTQTQVLGFPIIFVYMIVIALIAWWVLDMTPAGRYMYAIGSNSDAARLSGVHVQRWVWLSLISSATLAGLGGILFASFSGPSLTYGQSALLPAFAAAFLGSTQLQPGKFNVWGTILAIFVLATGVQGLSYVTGVQWLDPMFNGVALLVAVSFAVSRRRERVSARRPEDHPLDQSAEQMSHPEPLDKPVN